MEQASFVAKQTAIKNQILDAGRRVLERDALATLAEITKIAGFAKSAIHYYYPGGKAEFVRAVYRRALETETATPALHAAAIVLAQRDPELVALLPEHFYFHRDDLRLPTRAVAAE